jgi:hypothetical protein
MSIEIGSGATIVIGTDRDAATVIAVSKSGRKVTVQRDIARRTDSNGMSDQQHYEYARNPEGEVVTFSLRKNGRWWQVGRSGGLVLRLGERDSFYDYNF